MSAATDERITALLDRVTSLFAEAADLLHQVTLAGEDLERRIDELERAAASSPPPTEET